MESSISLYLAIKMLSFISLTNKNKNMAPKYKLNYFNITAKGEPIRLLFHAAGVEFEDNRVAFEEWGNIKPDGKETTFSVRLISKFEKRILLQDVA